MNDAKSSDWAGIILGFLIFAFAIYVYFMPSFIAKNRRHHNRNAIAILNLFFGWTLIGWVASLVWAFTSPPPLRVADDERDDIEEEPHDRQEAQRQFHQPIILPKANLPDYLFDKKHRE